MRVPAIVRPRSVRMIVVFVLVSETIGATSSVIIHPYCSMSRILLPTYPSSRRQSQLSLRHGKQILIPLRRRQVDNSPRPHAITAMLSMPPNIRTAPHRVWVGNPSLLVNKLNRRFDIPQQRVDKLN